jgi:isoleucyl-tRNA synthetase
MFKSVKPNVNFPELEKKIFDKWQKEGIVDKYLKKNNSSKKKFSFLDGPITANNPMGVHHAWGRTYKDLWQRFWNMRGYKQRFQNGFDEQGLWVEVEVEKELGIRNKREIENLVNGDKFKSLEKFINLCKERVKKFSAVQTEQSKRLGYFMDWDNSYHTSSDENNYAIWNFIKVVNKKGWLYKGRDSVPWCPRCGTAISQHEILTEEYKQLTHKTVVFKLAIKGKDKEYLLAWTTTPWTIPGNVALAVDKNLSYWKMENEKGEKIILINPTPSGDLKKEDMLVNKLELTKGYKKIEELKGSDLVGLEYEAPYDSLPAVKKALGKYKNRVIATDTLILPINPLEGTGIVHIAPGAGAEDFRLAQKEKLPAVEEIDESAVFTHGFDFLSGLHVKKAAQMILDDLEKRNLAHKISDYTHRYPTCWRCKTELVWRVVNEWYISMDKKDDSGKTYREQMVEVAKKINWLPEWGLDRELDWLKNMHDWLISKKRYWGLALPIWECKCGGFEVIGGKEELEKKAVSGWNKFANHSPHKPWIDEIKIKCSKCDEIVSRIPDVGNPWLDAGIVPFSTLPCGFFPADFITESFPGQFKNWFYSLIAMSTVLKKTNPFKTVLGFASVKDEKGEEMHKSKGNAIEFNQAADLIGVDVARWMYAKQDPEQNLNFGAKTADETRRKFHLLLWNIYNFFISNANIDNWTCQDKTKSENILDRWIMSKLNKLIKTVTESLEKYDAFYASNSIENFVNDLSLWYVRRSRNRVGLANENVKDKNDCYEILWEVLASLCQILAPFIPFISDEIYRNLTDEESVHLSRWPEVGEINDKLEEEMDFARKLCELGHAKRKELNIRVRQPLAEIKIKNSEFTLGKEIIELIKDELNIKKITFEKGKGEIMVILDTKITKALKEEGEARDIVREIQKQRKIFGTTLDEKVNVVLENWPSAFEDYIKRKASVDILTKGEKFLVVRK